MIATRFIIMFLGGFIAIGGLIIFCIGIMLALEAFKENL